MSEGVDRFKLGISSPVPLARALGFADEVERAVGEIANGQRKSGDLPLRDIAGLVQFVRNSRAAEKQVYVWLNTFIDYMDDTVSLVYPKPVRERLSEARAWMEKLEERVRDEQARGVYGAGEDEV